MHMELRRNSEEYNCSNAGRRLCSHKAAVLLCLKGLARMLDTRLHARIVPVGNSINPIEYLPIKDIGFTSARGN